MPGTLYVVATPIGNLGDVSERALSVLREVSLVACEDTRVTRKLFARFGIRTPVTSYHEHNEALRTKEVLSRLERGEDVALVSDAGTPLVSDPGHRLVKAARDAGVPVRAVPGPSALLAALSVSGRPTSRFTFLGFLPPKGSARREAIDAIAGLDHTIVLFEAPTRVARLLKELLAALGPRPAVLLREMTKLHEEHRAGSLDELASWAEGRKLRGEITLVIDGREAPRRGEATVSPDSLRPRFEELRRQGLSAREAARTIGRELRVPSRRVYDALAGKEKAERR